MADAQQGEGEPTARVASASLVRAFGVRGLYGYRTISFSSENAATVLIAKNGAGKTTLLGAMDAFLRCQFTRLRHFRFDEIYCQIRGHDTELKLSYEDVTSLLEVSSDGDVSKLARRADLNVSTLVHFLLETWPSIKGDRDYSENSIFSAVIKASAYRYLDAAGQCDRARDALLAQNPNVAGVVQVLARCLPEVEVVYLPTYRRVEASLPEDSREVVHRRRRARMTLGAGKLFSGDIQFGLSDILERLSEMNQRILVESDKGYREISANIIQELIDGSFDREAGLIRPTPTREELSLFFSRLQEGGQDSRSLYHLRALGPVPVLDLDKIFERSDISESSDRFLRYFLSKLATVIRATHDIELQVEEFISLCNKYLSSSDPTTAAPGARSSGVGLDGKALRLNKKDLKVHVESVPGGRKIPLDALSSGEKQMVSLFAKLLLYPGEKIVLVD